MAREKIAVLGTNSFMGRYFVQYLLKDIGAEVYGCSRSPEVSEIYLPYRAQKLPDYTFAQIDFNKDLPRLFSDLDSFKPDYIFNFSNPCEVATSWRFPQDYYQTNIVGTSALCDGLLERDYYKKFVHISSPEIYGSCEGNVTEDHAVNPSTPYAVSKAAGDFHMLCLAKHRDFRVVITRPTNIYGAYQQLYRIIPRSVIRIKNNEIIELHGGGKAVKSYLHMQDLSRGLYLAGQKGGIGGIYHFSPSDGGIAICDLVKLVCEKLGADFEKQTRAVDERLGQDAAYIIDSTRARNEFDWSDSVSLDEGISEVVQWIEQYWEEIQNEPMDYIHKG